VERHSERGERFDWLIRWPAHSPTSRVRRALIGRPQVSEGPPPSPLPQKQRANGLLLCAQCGRFFAKGRGLRDHQQIKHRRDYEAASAAVSDSAKQLSLYQWTPPALQSQWQAQAQHERTQRAALPPALEVLGSASIRADRCRK
jgi:hypothetical protein